MANIKLSKKEFEKAIKFTREVEEKITMFGTPLEHVNEEEIEIEIFPNRPDLLSLHGYLRGFSAFLGKKTGLKEYKINKPEKDFDVIVEPSVSEVRPFTTCAIIKRLNFDDEKIKEIVDIQEKIHSTYGRNRRKVAIGIYPLEKIKLPITYKAEKPEDIKFIPLESKQEMNARQILSRHPKGRDYANLLKDKEKFPVFRDANNEVLSLPPIINSEKTGKINKDTKDIFIECSGHDLESLKKTLNILVTIFADMDGKIYQMNVKYKKPIITPDLTPEKMQISIKNTNKLLGLELKEAQVKTYLEMMGHNYNKGEVEIPAWRTDILHENDLIEDVAIAYGYENFVPEIPNLQSTGQQDPMEIKKRKISEILTGLEFLETSSYHLTTVRDQFKKTGQKKQEVIEVEDSKTEYNILRNNLLHYALKILSENRDSEYPQKIFETGKVFSPDPTQETGIKETEHLTIAIADSKANFTQLKQVLEYLMKMLNKTQEYKIQPAENPHFIPGRCAEIIIDNKPIGHIGEIKPSILSNLKVKVPISALEIDITEL